MYLLLVYSFSNSTQFSITGSGPKTKNHYKNREKEKKQKFYHFTRVKSWAKLPLVHDSSPFSRSYNRIGKSYNDIHFVGVATIRQLAIHVNKLECTQHVPGWECFFLISSKSVFWTKDSLELSSSIVIPIVND